MTKTLARRDLLGASCRLLAGMGIASRLVQNTAAEEQQRSICLSCRDEHLKQTDATDCWSALRSIGAEGVEATIREDLSFPELFHPDRNYSAASQSGIEQLAADMKGANLRISAFCMYNRFEQRPEFELRWAAQAARAAKALGVQAIRIDLQPQKLAASEFLEFSIATLRKLIAATDSTGVAFGIENHGATTNNPEFLKPLLDRVGSKRLGLTLDTGNFYWFGHPLSKLYELYETFAPFVCHTHCKSIKYPETQREKQRPMGWEYAKYHCPIYEGDIDFRRVVKILRAAGYSNDLCVEDESLRNFSAQERGPVLAKEIRHLKELL